MNDSPIHVLLVEDNPGDVVLVRAALEAAEGAKFEVVSISRLGAAIDHANARPADVMMLDLGLPDAQGLETFLRAHAALPGIPILVLSGLLDQEIAIQAVQQGAQDYLVKGTAMLDVLPRAIRYAIERHRSQEDLERYAGELREKNAVLEEELRMAREIQQAWLPRQYPQFSDRLGEHGSALNFSHYYRPATALSGDFFNVMRLSDDRAGVLICDVMGHGVRAALIGALARGFIGQFAPVASDPAGFLSDLNRELAKTLKQTGIESFASAFYFVADMTQRELRYANAGHPNPLLLRRDAGTVDWLGEDRQHQPPLGLLEETSYRTSTCALDERDSVVLFTDGLYEEENARGEQFGHQRLLDAVTRRLAQPCETLLDDLVCESQKFSGHEEFADDVCLVGMDVVNGGKREERIT